MRMTMADIQAYPKLAYYVKNDIPSLLQVPAVVSAINRIGQINKARLTMALAWGHGPQIKVTAIAGAFGEFTPNSKSNEIRIDRQLVMEFEAGRGRRVARAGGVYLVGATLLHELVHWGDDQDGIDRPGEEGEEFERLLYGSVIQ